MAGDIIVTVPDGEGIRKDHWPADHSYETVGGCLRVRQTPTLQSMTPSGRGAIVAIYAKGFWIKAERIGHEG